MSSCKDEAYIVGGKAGQTCNIEENKASMVFSSQVVHKACPAHLNRHHEVRNFFNPYRSMSTRGQATYRSLPSAQYF